MILRTASTADSAVLFCRKRVKGIEMNLSS
jgi:hypothetical protein